MVKKILVLGHKGMLGNVVVKYFTTQENYEVLTTDTRWGHELFKEALKNTEASFIVNCIGAIPQKKFIDDTFTTINFDLPVFLETLNKRIIHPTTDCEFSGNIPLKQQYAVTDERDATDAYGKSKADISLLIEKSFKNTKMIRTSIIGHELASHVSLLDWFLSEEGEVSGYTDHYWNGVTTLQWAKLCDALMTSWDNTPTLNQFSSPEILSKYEILTIVKKIYNKDINIRPTTTGKVINKCLTSQEATPLLQDQLEELRNFYGK